MKKYPSILSHATSLGAPIFRWREDMSGGLTRVDIPQYDWSLQPMRELSIFPNGLKGSGPVSCRRRGDGFYWRPRLPGMRQYISCISAHLCITASPVQIICLSTPLIPTSGCWALNMLGKYSTTALQTYSAIAFRVLLGFGGVHLLYDKQSSP